MSNNTVRILPSPTWNWLRVNDIEVKDIETIGSLDSINFSDKSGKTIKLPLTHSENARHCVDLTAEADSTGTLIIDHASSGKNIVAGLTLNMELKENSHIILVEIVNMKAEDSLFTGIVANQEKGSFLKLIQVFLEGGEIYSNVTTDLLGEASSFTLKSAYSLKSKNTLDINYVVNHIGKKTECNLDTKGVIYEGATKVYRGTIDFKNGCKGAVGNEIEDVLLMDEDVVNKTVPIILCGEEDVEGNHGATIGRLSEDLIFYMKTRGIPEEDIYKVMAEGRLLACIEEIPDNDTVDRLERITGYK